MLEIINFMKFGILSIMSARVSNRVINFSKKSIAASLRFNSILIEGAFTRRLINKLVSRNLLQYYKRNLNKCFNSFKFRKVMKPL